MRLTSSIPVLRASDYPQARAFWTGTLGFVVIEEGGDPPRFGIFRRDAATVFVDAWHGKDPAPSLAWRAYFHCDEVDTLAAELQGRGHPIEELRNAPYGMRELMLRDPDGNLLCFGQDIA